MKDRGPITTHVLDTSVGKPAAGVAITLAIQTGADAWQILSSAVTDSDGRAAGFITAESFKPGVYRFRFSVGDYYRNRGTATFYPAAAIEFEVLSTSEHYHVPLLLSPFGYSTYRGS